MNSNKKPLIILTAGGTGGHVYPADALAEELSKRGYRLALVTDKRGKGNYKGKLGEIKNFSVLSGAIVGKSFWFKLKSLFKMFFGMIQCMYIIKYNKPICVIGFGGYASLPCCVAAILLKTKLIIHEQNSVMSRTNRLIGKRAYLIAQSFKDVKFSPKKTKSVLTGMPIRKSIIDIRNKRVIEPDKFHILVLGGSQGAKCFSEIVPETINKLSKEQQKKLVIYQQCREQDKDILEEAYKSSSANITISHFFNNMPEIYSKTDLIISRAGASSVSEILAVGIPSILVPLPTSADNHQFYNAKWVGEANAGYVVEQKDFNSEFLFSILNKSLDNKRTLEEMSQNAKSLGIINAAEKFADAVEEATRLEEENNATQNTKDV